MKASVKTLVLIALPEIIFLIFYYSGILMRIGHLAPANIVLTFSILILASIYLLLGIFMFSNSDPRQLKANNMGPYHIAKLIFGFMSGLALCFYSLSCWGIYLHLPIAYIFGQIALTLLVIVVAGGIILTFKFKRMLLSLIRFIISLVLISLPSLIILVAFK